MSDALNFYYPAFYSPFYHVSDAQELLHLGDEPFTIQDGHRPTGDESISSLRPALELRWKNGSERRLIGRNRRLAAAIKTSFEARPATSTNAASSFIDGVDGGSRLNTVAAPAAAAAAAAAADPEEAAADPEEAAADPEAAAADPEEASEAGAAAGDDDSSEASNDEYVDGEPDGLEDFDNGQHPDELEEQMLAAFVEEEN